MRITVTDRGSSVVPLDLYYNAQEILNLKDPSDDPDNPQVLRALYHLLQRKSEDASSATDEGMPWQYRTVSIYWKTLEPGEKKAFLQILQVALVKHPDGSIERRPSQHWAEPVLLR